MSAGSISVLAGTVLLALRLKMLLRNRHFEITLRTALQLTLAGFLFGSIFPGFVSGDAIKAVYLCSNSKERRVDLVAVVIMDRLIGVFSLFLLGTVALFPVWYTGIFNSLPLFVLTAPLMVSGFIIISFLLSRESLFKKPTFQRMPGPLRHLASAMRDIFRMPSLFAKTVSLSLCNHALVVSAFIIAGLLLQDTLSALVHFALDPLAMVLNVIPLTPGGLGIAESALSFVFEFAGSGNGAMIGLLGRFMQYIVFAIGGGAALLFLRLRGQLLSNK